MSQEENGKDFGLEAVWLAAIVVASLLMNSYGERSFEPTRAIFLQSLGVFGIVGLAFTILRSRKTDLFRVRLKSPIVAGVVLVFLSFLVSTWLSKSPQTSLWGSYDWGQGLLLLASCVVVFFAVLFGLKTQSQSNRIISTFILVGFGAAIYGMVQYFDSDPLAWQLTWNNPDFTRVSSTLGNPMYAGAFLTCVIPLCMAQLGFQLQQQELAWTTPMGLFQAIVLLMVFMVVWMIHPFLPVGLYVLVAGFSTYRLEGDSLRRSLQISTLVFVLSTSVWALLLTQSRGALLGLLIGLGIFFLLYLAVFTEASSKIRRYSGVLFLLVSIASSILFISIQMGDEGTRILRLESRSTEMRMLMWEGIWDVWDREPDRRLFGHGPDMTSLSFEASYPAALIDYEGGSRVGKAHNLFYETAITRGGFGVFSLVVFILAIWIACLRNLGILTSRRSNWTLLFILMAVGTLLTFLSLSLDSKALLAPIIAMGAILAVSGYLVGYLWIIRKKAEIPGDQRDSETWNTIGIGTSIFALFIALQSGIALSFEYLFLLSSAAILAVNPRFLPKSEPEEKRKNGAVVVLICMILGSGILQGVENLTVAWWIVVVTAGIALIHFDFTNSPKSIVKWTAFFGVLILVLVSVVPLIILTRDQNSLVIGMPLIFSLASWLVYFSWRNGTSKWPLFVACSAFSLILWFIHFPVLKADIAEQKAKLAMLAGNEEEAGKFLKKAIALQPQRDRYPFLLSSIYLGQARSFASEIKQDSVLHLAGIENKRAHDLAPIDGDHLLNRARLFGAWAQLSQDSTKKMERWSASIEHYTNYLPRRPEDYRIYKELAFTQESAGQTKKAIENYSRSVELEPRYIEGYLGEVRSFESISDSSGVFRVFDKVLQNEVYDIPLFFQLAQSLEFIGGRIKAISKIENDGEKVDLRREQEAFLSLLYWKENDCLKARQHLGKALGSGLADPNFRAFAKTLTSSCDASKNL